MTDWKELAQEETKSPSWRDLLSLFKSFAIFRVIWGVRKMYSNILTLGFTRGYKRFVKSFMRTYSTYLPTYIFVSLLQHIHIQKYRRINYLIKSWIHTICNYTYLYTSIHVRNIRYSRINDNHINKYDRKNTVIKEKQITRHKKRKKTRNWMKNKNNLQC